MLTRHRPIRASALAGLLAFALLPAGCGESTSPEGNQVASLALVTPPPGTITLGEVVTPAPVVELRSADGEPVRMAGALVAASVTNGLLQGTTSVRTGADGRATFSDLVLDGEVGATEIRFTCCDLAPAAQTVSLALRTDVTVLSPVSAERVFGPTGGLMTPGPSVMAVGGNWLPVPGAVVRFSLQGSGSISDGLVTTNAEGIAELPSYRFGEMPSTAILIATLEGTTRTTRFELSAVASGEVTLLDAGFGTTGPYGAPLVVPPVLVTKEGAPQAGVPVHIRWVALDGIRHVDVHVTGAEGRIDAVTLPKLLVAGDNTVEIFVPGFSAGPLIRNVVGQQDYPLRFDAVVINIVPSDRPDGRTLVPLHVVNSRGTPVPDVRIMWSDDHANGFLEWWDMFGPEWMGPFYTDELGSAVLAWTIPAAPGTYRITVSSPEVAEPITFTAVRE